MGGKEKEKQVTVSVTLEIVLTQEDIDDIMCGALEGGITYWCDEAKVVGDYPENMEVSRSQEAEN